MEEVQALCPRVGIIDHGQLIACETVANLLASLPSRNERLLRLPSACQAATSSLRAVRVATWFGFEPLAET